MVLRLLRRNLAIIFYIPEALKIQRICASGLVKDRDSKMYDFLYCSTFHILGDHRSLTQSTQERNVRNSKKSYEQHAFHPLPSLIWVPVVQPNRLQIKGRVGGESRTAM